MSAPPRGPAVVDVLITAFNAQSTIVSAIESIQRQTLRDIRIVIVDDGSTDATRSLVERLAACDDRIVLIGKGHSGIVPSLQLGLTHCTSAFIARFDADDISLEQRLERQLAQLNGNPDWIAVASAARHVDQDGHWLGTVTDFASNGAPDPSWIPCREPYLLQPFLMVRRAALDAVGGYRLCEVAEDSDLYWRLAALGTLMNTDDVFGDYRWHPESISSRSIVRGRRIAFWSQLIGISALRRANGQEDVEFDVERLATCSRATSLDEHCRWGGTGLTECEMTRLRAGIAAKMLEVTKYRPFEIDHDDCRFIGRALRRAYPILSSENRAAIDDAMHETALRLIFKGEATGAYLLDPARFPWIFGRWLFRKSLPDAARRRLKTALGRS